MPSNYALAAQCQLKRDEVHELLALSAAATSPAGDSNEASGGCNKHSLWRLLLTDAHVRSLIQHTLVRVSIPKSKQQPLIHGNKYIRAGSQVDGSREGQPSNYRVGKVVALVPRPRASPEAPRAAGDASSSVSLLSDWLLGINFGEVTELLGAKYVSNEPFTAEEHAVYLHSSLSTRTDTTAPVAVGASAIMTASEADVVIRNLQDIRQFVAAVTAGGNGAATTTTAGDMTSNVRGGRKRPRDAAGAVGEEYEGGVDSAGGHVHNKQDDEEATITREELLAERARHREERRQWEALRDEQKRHLTGLRQLLNSKNDEIQRVLRAQRQAEAEHVAEVEQWRLKTDEQGQTIRRTERVLAEERAAQKELREKTDKLVTQLKKLAEQTRKFKEVSDTVAEWLRTGTKQPEEVLTSLRKKIAESQV